MRKVERKGVTSVKGSKKGKAREGFQAMRRFYCIPWNCLVLSKPPLSRRLSSSTETPEAIRDAIAADERDQRRREEAVDERSVVFACGSSADHRPRIAAAEAFDVAAAALSSTPNFCFMNVSMDYAGMIDAPEVVWYNLCKVNDVTPSTVRPQQLHMIGGATRLQRPGGGFVQVMLGCIPDLQSDTFTFDTIPEEDDLAEAHRPSPAICFALMDNKLTLQYERQLVAHLQVLSERLGGCPLTGGIYPAVQKSAGTTGDSGDETKEEKGSDNDIGDSLFFLNDRVYTGSAACIVLRSEMVKAHNLSVVPSIAIGKVAVTSISSEVEGVFVVKTLEGRRATDVIHDVYCSPEMKGKPSRVFLGLQHNDFCIPVSFIGNPGTGELRFSAPKGISVAENGTVQLLVDDVELDSEVGAGALIGLHKRVAMTYATKDVNVAREARRNVVASSAAAFHYSHPGMNVLARPEVNITLGNSSAMYAPSLLQRCLGGYCSTTGVFCPGQVITLGNATGVFARSSSYTVLEGLK